MDKTWKADWGGDNLLLHGGQYNGQTIVSGKWVHTPLQSPLTRATNWGFIGSQYALCWHHISYDNQPVTYGMERGGQWSYLQTKDKKAAGH